MILKYTREGKTNMRKIPKTGSVKDLHNLMKKYQKKGLKPYLKGKGNGTIKIEFDD